MYEKGEVDSAEAHAGQVERGHKVSTSSIKGTEVSLTTYLHTGCYLQP